MGTKPHVVIIGAGPGGLCAAMLLSTRGFEVTVLEQRDDIGGRSGALKLGDYVFDVGSTMLMMPFVLEEMFALAGRRLADEVKRVSVDPMYRLDFGGRALDVFSDAERMEAELKRFSPGEERGLHRFLETEHRRLEHLYPVLQRSFPALASLVSPEVLAALPYVGLGRSVHGTAGDYFTDPALKLGFSFQAAYLGMSPWTCPGGFALVPYVEHAWGIDHVRGGIHELSEALARVARENGATIRTGARVRRITVAEGRCTGVELDTLERIEATDVVINADATSALEHLLDKDVSLRFSRKRLEHQQESCSTFMMYLGLDTTLPLAHHTFYFANDYRDEMRRVFDAPALGSDFSLYACNPVRTDPTMAPPGHSALYLLALVPNTRARINWAERAPELRTQTLAMLARRSGVDVRPHIRVERIMTPNDWERGFSVSHGAVFGPAHSISQLLAFRAPNQLPSPRHVYLTGGGTNPGSGLPTIFESARIVSRLVCERHQVPFPASLPLPEPSMWRRAAPADERALA